MTTSTAKMPADRATRFSRMAPCGSRNAMPTWNERTTVTAAKAATTAHSRSSHALDDRTSPGTVLDFKVGLLVSRSQSAPDSRRGGWARYFSGPPEARAPLSSQA